MLFSASKDHVVNVWYTSNGERLGTFNGHKGSVWTVACDCEWDGFPDIHWLRQGVAEGLLADNGRCRGWGRYDRRIRRRKQSESRGLREGAAEGFKRAIRSDEQRLIAAQTKYLVTGAADNTMRLWEIATGKLLYTWEFLTAVKRVAWRCVLGLRGGFG